LRFPKASVRDDGTTMFVRVGSTDSDSVGVPVAGATGAAETSLTKVGDPLPEFSVTDLDGGAAGSARLRGHVGIVVFWATWCPACRAELPRVEKDLWRRFDSPELAFVAVARGQSAAEVRPFREQNHFTMPMAVDPDRSAYARFATQGIPRLYVVSPAGVILLQMVGFDEARFAEAQAIVLREVTALRAQGAAGSSR
jgi:peroxiredoxin